MSFNDFCADIQSDSQALETSGRFFNAVKLFEYLGLKIRRNTDPEIFHSKVYFALWREVKMNIYVLAGRGILDRIGSIINDHLFQPRFIAIHLNILHIALQGYRTFLGLLNNFNGIFNHLTEIK